MHRFTAFDMYQSGEYEGIITMIIGSTADTDQKNLILKYYVSQLIIEKFK